jgi:hypothetical protein
MFLFNRRLVAGIQFERDLFISRKRVILSGVTLRPSLWAGESVAFMGGGAPWLSVD